MEGRGRGREGRKGRQREGVKKLSSRSDSPIR